MIENMPKKQQRRLAIGLLSVIGLLLVTLVVLPVWSINDSYGSRIDQLQTRLERLRLNADADEALRPQYERLVRSQSMAGHHLKSDTEAVAAAELQRIVKSIVTRNSTQILSTQILPATEEQGFVRVSLKVNLRGSIEGMVQSLYDIEANPIFLFLDKMSIRNSARRQLRGGIQINQFDNEFELIAYMPKPI
jgi:general secretion pathway protein M